MATLTYTGGTVDSNIVTGELREVLTVVKTAVNKSYELGGRVTYVISLSNSGAVALTGLTLTDDLGGYAFGGTTLYPLAYVEGSLRYFQNGVLQDMPAVVAGPPMTVTGVTVPAGGSALVVYETAVTRYTPMAAESTVTNTVTVTGGGLAEAVTAQETVGVASGSRLSVCKEPFSHRGGGKRSTDLYVHHSEPGQHRSHRRGRCDAAGCVQAHS